MDSPMIYSPTFKPPFVIDNSRDRLQVRLRKEHLEGYLLINLPQYDPAEAMIAAMSVIKSMDINMLKKEPGRNSSAWMSLTGHPWSPATTLSGGIHFALPLATVRDSKDRESLVASMDTQQDQPRGDIVSPPLKPKPRPVGAKETKRTRAEDDGDEQRSPKRPDSRGFTRWFPWSSASPEPASGN
ncbi:hypothetical protein FPANT_7532 [Fusarium pseudoanthophilum]|uniref:Uncharacterized protein n=1 Tax=Fusarium pseudoanthophilum TaxID=48495 RepID=A0A8H5L7S6_9HYPO|nr:hypothetical protein FPANT_7532 [Fusarium pseudoanthophilum]